MPQSHHQTRPDRKPGYARHDHDLSRQRRGDARSDQGRGQINFAADKVNGAFTLMQVEQIK